MPRRTADASRYTTTDVESHVREATLSYQQKKVAKKKSTAQQLESGAAKRLTVKFRSRKDASLFAEAIGQVVSAKQKTIRYNPNARVRGKFVGEPAQKKTQEGMSTFHAEHWKGMPTFEQERSKWEWHRVCVLFDTRTDYEAFAYVVRQPLKMFTKSIYYPEWTPATLSGIAWKSSLPAARRNPQFPVYIISRGRAHSRLTSKALEKMKVPHYIVVEPDDYESYAAVMDEERILTLPWNSDPKNPTGPGRARSWCRDHSWVNGFKRHWVLDDNIEGFYRLHQNRRHRVLDGTIFRAAEDFVERYTNIAVAGFQYRFFCASKSKYPPFVCNTRIYSCLLVDNTILFEWRHAKRKKRTEKPLVVKATARRPMDPHQFLWRERYNEDTILSLDFMENGYATVQFNAFLQGKSPTQKMGGGNSDIFYLTEDVEGMTIDVGAAYHEPGTLRKSLTLQVLYPEVATVTFRFNRVHHHVDYAKYKDIPLKRKPRSPQFTTANEYGMRLVRVLS